MDAFREKFQTLLTLSQLYLFQEYQGKGALTVSQETFDYFKKTMAGKKRERVLTPAPTLTPAPIVKAPLPPISVKKPPLPFLAPKEEKKEKLEPAKEEKTKPKSEFEIPLEIPSIPSVDTFEALQSLYQQTFPTKKIIKPIPDDAEALKKSMQWKLVKEPAAITILSFNEIPNHQVFLYNISKAIESIYPEVEIRAAPSIENTNEWDAFLKAKTLKLVIATDIGLQACPNLMKFFKETQKSTHHYLDRIPLFLLSDLSFYLKEAKLKQPLWEALREILSKISKKQ